MRAADLPSPPGDGDVPLWLVEGSAGLLLGGCCGMALKQLGKSLAVAVGIVFLATQACVAAGAEPPALGGLRAYWRRWCEQQGFEPQRLSFKALRERAEQLGRLHTAAATGFAPGVLLGLYHG